MRCSQDRDIFSGVALSGRHNLAHPAPKEGFELLGIKRTKQTIKSGRGRYPVLQRQEALESRLTGLRPKGKVLAGVHIAEAGTDGNHQHFPEVVQLAVAGCPRVIDLIEAVHQSEVSMAHFVRPKDENRPVS